MTENMAGRGEGLAGLIERVISAGDDLRYDEYGVMEMPTGHLATKWDIAKKELQTALEAAAPPGTPRVPDELVREIIADALIGSHGYGGSLSRARMDISNRIEKWLAALKYYASHADGGTGVAEAALATPSPQAPPTAIKPFCIGYPNCDGDLEGEEHSEQCRIFFSTTSAREQSSATAANNPSTGDMRAILDHCWRIIEETQQDTGRFGTIRGSARKIMSFGLPGNNPLRIVEVTPLTEDTKLWLNGKKVPAATQEQEQPAGSEASENDLWLELAKILRFEKGDDGDWFIPAEPQPLGPFFSILQAAIAFMRFMDATDKAMREEIEQLRVGSPRKVGEDGAQCEFHGKPKQFCGDCANEMVRPYQVQVPEFLSKLRDDMKAHQQEIIQRSNKQRGRARNRTRRYSAAMEDFIRYVETALDVRSSSVPVGEQKQEEGV